MTKAARRIDFDELIKFCEEHPFLEGDNPRSELELLVGMYAGDEDVPEWFY